MGKTSILGAIAGDIIGSVYEFDNIKTRDFEPFAPYHGNEPSITDDSLMTLAVAKALMDTDESMLNLPAVATDTMRKFAADVPGIGYGPAFRRWLTNPNPQPYGSWGNGAAMRVSPCAWVGDSVGEVKVLSWGVTAVTHNHPEGIKGAEATAVATFLARTGSSMAEIRDVIDKDYYKIDFTLDEIRPSYGFDVSCQGSVPQALEAFFESTSFLDAIRNAVSIGGDSDTIAAITGAVAGAYYGVPDEIQTKARAKLTEGLIQVLDSFESLFIKAY